MNGSENLRRGDDGKRVGNRPDAFLKIRIVLLVIAVITPLGGVSFFIISSFQKPIMECFVMMRNITGANNLIFLERQVIDRELYDAIGNVSHAERRDKFLARISEISGQFRELVQYEKYPSEAENLAILTKLQQSFEEECARAMNNGDRMTMRNRLEAYQKATEVHAILEKNVREYISLQIRNRNNLAENVKETIRGLLILSILVVALILSGCLVTGVLFAGRFSDAIRKEIEERIRAENNLKAIVNLDPLTKLSNRRFFLKSLESSIEYCRKENSGLTLLFLDLDGFKEINDSFGHEAGDDILIITAQRLSGAVRDNDLIARIGGDEFTGILIRMDDKAVISSVCRRIITECAVPIRLGDSWGGVTASIGICRLSDLPRDRDTPDLHRELLARADRAMYEAKRRGKNVFVFFDEIEASLARAEETVIAAPEPATVPE